MFVLSELKKKNGRHFCEMMDKGRFQGFNYVVMTFVGKCLEVRDTVVFVSGLRWGLREG